MIDKTPDAPTKLRYNFFASLLIKMILSHFVISRINNSAVLNLLHGIAASTDNNRAINDISDKLRTLMAPPITANGVIPNNILFNNEAATCKICNNYAPVLGYIDFNKSCEERNGVVLPRTGINIYFNRCESCGFIFSVAFDQWTLKEFCDYIYNDQYHIVDPEYDNKRPLTNAIKFLEMFKSSRATISILDYGGGNGVFEKALTVNGFSIVNTYDPLVDDYKTIPDRRYDIVTCFETLEHLPDPVARVEQICGLVKDDGLIVFSTAIWAGPFPKDGLSWWYISPRNGHISIYTMDALVALWGKFGYKVASSNYGYCFAFRTIPDFAKHL